MSTAVYTLYTTKFIQVVCVAYDKRRNIENTRVVEGPKRTNFHSAQHAPRPNESAPRPVNAGSSPI